MRNWQNVKKLIGVFWVLCLCSGVLFAQELMTPASSYADRTKLISEQIELLRNRLTEAQNEMANLQYQHNEVYPNLDLSRTNKQLRTQVSLDIAVAKSNLDSINLEIFESQQTISRLGKDSQELENELNVFSMFGLKIETSEAFNVNGLKAELAYQKGLIGLEQTRAEYLNKLQKVTEYILQLQKIKYVHLSATLKSRSIMQLKQRQAQSEIDYQQQQSYWLQQLNSLYAQLNKAETAKIKDPNAYAQLQRDIFYANEHVNFAYLQMLVIRYKDQLQQLKINVSHSASITLLNKANDQVLALTKQVARVKELLQTRDTILERRKAYITQSGNKDTQADISLSTDLASQYVTAIAQVTLLDQKLVVFRSTLDQALKTELASRQGLPGGDAKEWLDLGAEVWLVPALTFQVMKSLGKAFINTTQSINYFTSFMLVILELFLVFAFVVMNNLLGRFVAGMANHEFGHINLKWLFIQLVRRNLVEIALITNLFALFYFFDISLQNSALLLNIALIFLFFKVLIDMARITLVETTHDHSGHDVRLYKRLKWSFLVGGVVTTLTALIHQLPVVYEVKDLFDRAFLLFLLVVSIFLLKSWEVLPRLIIPHVDERRLYLKKVVLMLGFLIPLILLVNSAIGLFGYVNFVLTVSWFESVFLSILVGYLLIRGLLIDGMMLLSSLIIRNVVNGWLLTEAFLKPLDKILRVGLFILAWVVLFLSYGWDSHSQVVMKLNAFLHYNMVDMLNFSLSPLVVVELFVLISIFFWSARWTREFVYRLLATRTKDMGLRNSIAMFTQYLVVLAGIFVCLRVLNIDLETLKFVLGGFSIGIGLGLRDLANNYVCGLLLLIERPVRVGDTVSIGEYEGDVTHIGGRAVTMRTWDHMEVLIPNAEIFSRSFTNWTAKDHIIRSVITIKINRHDKPVEVQALILQTLSNQKDILSDPHPEVLLKELNDGLLELEIRYFINLRQVKSRVSVRSEVLMSIWEAFEKNKVYPSYPQHEVHLHKEV